MSQGAEIVAVDPGSSVSAAVPADDVPTWSRAVEYGRRLIPVVIGALAIVTVMLLVDRTRFLSTFDTDFSDSGLFQVTQCQELGGDSGQWRCNGSLTEDGRLTEVPSRLVATRGSLSSSRPYVGERLDVFFETGDNSTVYPQSARLGELTRLYVQLVPMFLLLLGALLWLTGWVAKMFGPRPGSTDEMIVVEKGRQLQPSWAASEVGFGPLRLPAVGALQRRGGAWLVTGFVAAVAVAVLTRIVLGSLGLP